MYTFIKYIFKTYFEAIAFTLGLVLLGLMDPGAFNGPSFCLFEQVGITFCPGNGLGHSISYVFRGEIYKALEYNIIGPFAIIILVYRIVYLLSKNRQYSHIKL